MNIMSAPPVKGSGYVTTIHKLLVEIPKPKEKIPVAVYKFRDETGQYKSGNNGGNSISTAVTQGATSILIKALEDSGWFLPLERENLGDLLQERRIIIQMQRKYLKKPYPQILPPLLYAGVIFEGGIIGYDSDVVTGGAGAKYFGLGGSVQYRIDRVTIYLRVVSVKTGAILKSVQETKVILSKEIRGSFFRYVRFNQLLEAEAGISVNEPVEMAVQEAIEKAVLDIIIEGVKSGLWQPANYKKFKEFLKKVHYQP
ncbi:MAG: curlin [Thermodesulfobacteria bacterium]|nr:curlin [Thermodesulfobacteriota bacterium]